MNSFQILLANLFSFSSSKRVYQFFIIGYFDERTKEVTRTLKVLPMSPV
ncbi:hypothetical protein LEP1GSC125_3852 [Leptospira mayottensis 200901122]|uniref:Uncharacterized protein n=1 Tax=Leptospira mayottensis 200901122 TaxID=1193010 RepID=A0AA87MKW5_9LEPT|nr:hypothetical protein LEP1GSC125_3852 [Leptospira mayottensis 200901122]